MQAFLKKFIISSLFASALFIFAKLLGLWASLYFTGTTFAITTGGDLSNFLTVATERQAYNVAFYADTIFTIITILAGATILIKTILFNDLTRNPRVLVKVIHMNLTGWLEDGQDMYPKLFAWEAFLWVATILIIKDTSQYGFPYYLAGILGSFTVYYTYQVFSFLDSHISDMISYLYGTK